jgi:hypothetical protein
MTASGERLLRTSRAQRWISQFDPGDRGTAELLVRSLTLVPKDELETTLAGLIRHRRSEVVNDPLRAGERESPIALFAIREIDRYYDLREGTRLGRHSKILGRAAIANKREIGATLLPFYFETCELDARAAAVGTTEVGSEGDIAYLITRLWRQTRRVAAGFLSHPSVDKLRQNKCRDIFLVDDLIASGDRACEFITAFRRHPTIASWLKGGLLRVSVIAFAATQLGLEQVRKANRRVSAVQYEHDVVSGQHWPEDRRQLLIALCRRYGKRTSSPEMALGYGSTDDAPQGLCSMVFSYKCPNNAPSILWAGKGSEWMPLFQRIPAEGLLDCFQAGAGDARRSTFFALLKAIHGRHRSSVEDINRRTGLGMSACRRGLEWCELNGLVSGVDGERLRLTKAGRRELQHFERAESPRPKRSTLAEPETFYYPTQLRASQGCV